MYIYIYIYVCIYIYIYIICMYIYIYIYVARCDWVLVRLGITQYLPTSFSRWLLESKKY